MAIVNMSEMLQDALKNRKAIGAFNILDYLSMKSVVDSAKELKLPVIIQTSVKTVLFWGYEAIINWYHQLVEKIDVPAAIHLDHCKDIEVIKKCIDYGWTSVMIDASTLPYEENFEITREVIKLAKPHNVTVEAELGSIVGVEDDIHVKEQDAHLADPKQAKEFCDKLDLDCFAPAIGTAHGVYKGKPDIAFSLIEEISKDTGIPLALHGGTGISDEDFIKCISLGCAKINISTQLKYDVIDSFVNYHQENARQYNPLKVFDAQYKQLKQGIREKMKLFAQ